ncbi:MAG: hypothetical protein K6W08_07665, partial [Firmicutes bacterium]|nr:hypothetical protein [Bacillota bacterium]
MWSIVCLYVARPCRGRGVVAQLLRGAMASVRTLGGTAMEACAGLLVQGRQVVGHVHVDGSL